MILVADALADDRRTAGDQGVQNYDTRAQFGQWVFSGRLPFALFACCAEFVRYYLGGNLNTNIAP